MPAAVIAHLSTSLPIISLLLQGAASGALIASVVLCRARLRGLRVQPWAVTAAWSTFGAALALVYLVVSLLW